MRTAPGALPPASEVRVRGWKDIGRWFGVDERTVKRWEASRGLPVHRVPGEARAPVFAFEAELAQWLQSREGAGAATAAPDAVAPRSARRGAFALAGIIGLVALAILAWQGWQLAETRQQEVSARTADVRVLARSQVAELSDRLEKQPGTVRLRAALASEAAAMLAKVAALPDAGPDLRREAAEAYRRLAVVQNAIDRPSLRDRPAARASLDTALALIAEDKRAAAQPLRAQLLIDSARLAAGGGNLAEAPALLVVAEANIVAPSPALRDELALAQSEVAQWQGNYRRAIVRAEAVFREGPQTATEWLRQIKARDLDAEARYYGGEKPTAIIGYRAALAMAEAGRVRFPSEPALNWQVRRQQWNLGTSLADAGQWAAALPLLQASRDGWMAMAATDPEDQALAAWVRTTRLSYGEGLAGAGQRAAAIAELSQSLADRRAWLAAQPAATDRQRALVVGLNALADVLATAGRRGEACGLINEAQAMTARMAAAGALTGLDRDSLLRQLDAGRAGACPAA